MHKEAYVYVSTNKKFLTIAANNCFVAEVAKLEQLIPYQGQLTGTGYDLQQNFVNGVKQW